MSVCGGPRQGAQKDYQGLLMKSTAERMYLHWIHFSWYTLQIMGSGARQDVRSAKILQKRSMRG